MLWIKTEHKTYKTPGLWADGLQLLQQPVHTGPRRYILGLQSIVLQRAPKPFQHCLPSQGNGHMDTQIYWLRSVSLALIVPAELKAWCEGSVCFLLQKKICCHYAGLTFQASQLKNRMTSFYQMMWPAERFGWQCWKSWAYPGQVVHQESASQLVMDGFGLWRNADGAGMKWHNSQSHKDQHHHRAPYVLFSAVSQGLWVAIDPCHFGLQLLWGLVDRTPIYCRHFSRVTRWEHSRINTRQ